MAMVTDSEPGPKDADEELETQEAKRFRSIAALANYVALDWSDVKVAVSVLCRDMARPTRESLTRLTRVGGI